MGSCCPKASAKETACPEVVVPKVTFNVIENPVVLKAAAPGADGALQNRPATPIPNPLGKHKDMDEDESKSAGAKDSDGEQTWEEVA